MIQKNRPRLTIVGRHEALLDGQVVPYILKRSPRAKCVRLEVRVETGLTVVIPRSYMLEKIPDLLRQKWRWLSRKLAEYGKGQQSAKSLEDGDTIPYLGRGLEVVIRHSDGESVSIEQDRLVVSLRAGNDGLGTVLEQWYRMQATQLIGEKANKLAADLGLKYGRLTIRGQRTRWGSCSPTGNLSFNWKLMMAPELVIDYVILHELAHLKELNHTKRFWQLVGQYCPEWHEHKKWLREHTVELATRLPK